MQEKTSTYPVGSESSSSSSSDEEMEEAVVVVEGQERQADLVTLQQLESIETQTSAPPSPASTRLCNCIQSTFTNQL